MVQAKHAFSRISGIYQRFRPHYPAQVFVELERILSRSKTPSASRTLVDIGCGTGIATRQLRAAMGPAPRIVGVDVNRNMLKTARQASAQSDAIEYTQGTAEALPFPDNSVDLVIVAQAIQWFDRPKFYPEVCRILRPDGVLAVMRNNRSWQSSVFLEQYEELLETLSPGYVRSCRDIDLQGEIRQVAGLKNGAKHRIRWNRHLTRADFIGMALSSSKTQAAIRHCGRATVLRALESLVVRFGGKSGELRVPYVSELYLAKKRKRAEFSTYESGKQTRPRAK